MHCLLQMFDRVAHAAMLKPCSLHDVTSATQAAMAALMALDDEQRARVLCWFCRGCGTHVGPGEYCHCENDE